MKKSLSAFVLALLIIVTPASAGPTDWSISAHILAVEGTYMPTSITFQADQSGGTASQCATGQWLEYFGQGPDTPTQQANAKAVYAMVLSAKLSGQTLTVYGSNNPGGDGFCAISHVILQ